MGIFSDLLGTSKEFFKIGINGPRVKASAGNLVLRNSADSADVELTVAKANISGNDVDLNSDAAGSGADWKYTLRRPNTGMAADVVLTLPADDGTAGQIIQTDGNGVLSFVSAGATGHADKLDTTALAFGSTSPVAMFSTGAGDVLEYFEIIIDTAFDGTPSLSIGIAGTTSKYVSATDLDLTAAAATKFIIHPGLDAQGAEDLIATYAAGGATVGAARIIAHYATPV